MVREHFARQEALHVNINRDANRELAADVAEERIIYGMRVPGRSPRIRKLIGLACQNDFHERQCLLQRENIGQRV